MPKLQRLRKLEPKSLFPFYRGESVRALGSEFYFYTTLKRDSRKKKKCICSHPALSAWNDFWGR